jgi:hypothetical protein
MRQDVHAHAHAARQTQAPPAQLVDIRQLFHESLHFPEKIVSGSDEDFPRIGQRDMAAVAVEERASELSFEQADLPADGGLGDVQPLSRAREAAFLGDGQEHLELADVHQAALPAGASIRHEEDRFISFSFCIPGFDLFRKRSISKMHGLDHLILFHL